MGVLSFYGIEVIAVTSGEAQDPVANSRALRSMGLRLFLFYILALGIMVTFCRGPKPERRSCSKARS